MGRILQTALDPAGPQAAHIERLWWFIFWVTTIVFVLVLAATAMAVARGQRRRRDGGAPISQAQLTRAVSIAVGTTVAILFVLLAASAWTGRAIASLHASSAVTINITG